MSAYGLEINKNQEAENKITDVEELNEEKNTKIRKMLQKIFEK